MFKNTKVFSSLTVGDLAKAKEFYGDTLGIKIEETPEGFNLHPFGMSIPIFVYEVENHFPSKHTVLNFMVDDVDKVVDELIQKGVQMEHYDMPEMKTDDKGIMRNTSDIGPKAMAWFKDSSGNILSVLDAE